MPQYDFNGQTVRRKNLYMPCAIGPRYDEASPEEQAEILKATYWADFVAASEWPALLREEGFSPSARSRLKKKAAGWMIVLGRIAVLNPTLLAEIIERAQTAYEEQTEEPYPRVVVGGGIAALQTFRNAVENQTGLAVRVSEWEEEDE